jgi:colanic acid biosynthesis glycosyl transferase WcaI
MRQAQVRGLDNVLFKPLQPLRRLAQLLATADVSLIPQKAAVKDCVLPSKLGNVMASARPVVVAAEATSELGRIVLDADCGRIVKPGDGAQMAEAILSLRADVEARNRLGRNGRSYMERHFTSGVVLKEFVDTLLTLVRDRSNSADTVAGSA